MPKGGVCLDCGTELGARNRSGFCRRCVGRANLRKPGIRVKIAEKNRERMASPEVRAEMSRRMKLRLAADPELREKYVATMRKANQSPACYAARRRRWAAEKPWIKGNEAQPAGSEPRQRAARAISATRLSWCPPHLRDEYRFLTEIKRLLAAEARQMIEDQHEVEMTRWRREHGYSEDVAA